MKDFHFRRMLSRTSIEEDDINQAQVLLLNAYRMTSLSEGFGAIARVREEGEGEGGPQWLTWPKKHKYNYL